MGPRKRHRTLAKPTSADFAAAALSSGVTHLCGTGPANLAYHDQGPYGIEPYGAVPSRRGSQAAGLCVAGSYDGETIGICLRQHQHRRIVSREHSHSLVAFASLRASFLAATRSFRYFPRRFGALSRLAPSTGVAVLSGFRQSSSCHAFCEAASVQFGHF